VSTPADYSVSAPHVRSIGGRRVRFVESLVLAVACGCGGEEPERVSYQQSPLDGAPTVVAASEFGWPAGGDEPSKLALDRRTARQDEPLVLQGRIRAAGNDVPASILVYVRGPLGDSPRAIVTSGIGSCEADGDGWLKYRAECAAHGRGPMHCDVEILDVGGHVVATGEIELE
jgi:hypothetical protein